MNSVTKTSNSGVPASGGLPKASGRREERVTAVWYAGGVTERRRIDHVAHRSDLVTAFLIGVTRERHGRRLSDHDGVVADVVAR